MDKFQGLERKNIMKIESDCNHNCINIYVSYDRFRELERKLYSIPFTLPINITIYDEAIVSPYDRTDIGKRIDFLSCLQGKLINHASFQLSDDTLPLYNSAMNRLNWYPENTELSLSLDRNPAKSKKLDLDIARGNLKLREEDLIRLDNSTLSRIRRVSPQIISNTKELKNVIQKFCNDTHRRYDLSRLSLSPYHKIILAYNYVLDNVPYGNEYIMKQGDTVFLKPNVPNYIKEPLGCYQHGKGICEGQARLMTILLNNNEMDIDATTIIGYTPIGHHAWVGTIVNDCLTTTCLSKQGVFFNPKEAGYTRNDPNNRRDLGLYKEIYLEKCKTKRLGDQLRSVRRDL